MRLITFIPIVCSLLGSAITVPAKLLRACLDYDNSIVTVEWVQPADLCGSFTKYSLYASENGGAFTKIVDIPSLSMENYPHDISNQGDRWRYYITTHTTCNGVDSLISNIIAIDKTYPTNIELDSVSYDLVSQELVAGWSKNPSIDTKHYELYDYSSGSGDYLGKTTDLTFNVSKSRNGFFPVVLATLDSCNLSSLLSKPHRAMRLNSSIDTCLGEIYLNWNLYEGWDNISRHEIFVSVNNGPYSLFKAVSEQNKNFVYDKFMLGDTITAFVRAWSQNGTKSSSSNIVKLETRAQNKPSEFKIDVVDVVDNSLIIRFISKNNNDVSKFFVWELGETEPIASVLSNSDETEFIVEDNINNPNDAIFHYNVTAINLCGDSLTSTSFASNIYFDPEKTPLHNPYDGWLSGAESYRLEKYNGFTWNVVEENTGPIEKGELTLESGCYRVVAREKNNETNISHSNEVCINKPLNVYITTALNPQGLNKNFSIKGEGIDHNQSFYTIYNRWGEIIKKSKTNEPWDGYYNGNLVTPGVYLYVVDIQGFLGEKLQEKGVVNVVR